MNLDKAFRIIASDWDGAAVENRASGRAAIEQAKEDWQAGRFAPVPDETEFIPLPEKGPAVVRYP